MKKTLILILALLLLLSVSAFAAEEVPDISQFELPKPAAPVYLIYDAADRTATEGSDALYTIAVFDQSVAQLGAEYEADSDAFLAKYGLYDFGLYVQFDTSLDGTDCWNHTAEWDTCYYAPSSNEATAVQSVRASMFEEVNLFDLYKKTSYPESYSAIADALIQRDVPGGDYTFQNFYFDHEHHSLHIRVRYYMEWETWDGETVGDTQSKVSPWSDVSIFGQGSNAITPEAPTGYGAPAISDLQYVPPGEGQELGCLTYLQVTPKETWLAGIYYEMTGDGSFEGLETQISLDGGQWQPYTTVDASGDWCLWNGARTAYYEEPRIEAGSHVRLRVRFIGTHGPSEWSNILELNGGGTQVVPTQPGSKPTPSPAPMDKCGLCGFCPVPLGLCIFIWLAILLAIILIVVILLACKPKKCKHCGQKLKKDEQICPNCGTQIRK